MMNESPFIGLIAGSITLTGGHGNAGAWGPILADKYGVTGAVELAMACATLGLVLGGLVGGPVARHLLKKVSIPKTTEQERDTIVEAFEQPSVKRKINANPGSNLGANQQISTTSRATKTSRSDCK